jgi:beta-mannanase
VIRRTLLSIVAVLGGVAAAACTAPEAQAPPTPASSSTAVVPATAAVPAGGCVTGALLVPSCGVLWGAAAGGFTSEPRDAALKDWEAMTGRTATIFHTYHRGDELFPTPAEIAMTRDRAHPRVLLVNWRVTRGATWAQVAAGERDARLDRWAAYVAKTYHRRFFLVLDHEPEPEVNAAVGSGMTARDYAAMYRHVVSRLRADGVTNAVNVVAYMGNEKWMATPWWKDLYPGADYVDWIGLDSYISVERGRYHYGTFGDLLNRAATDGGPGFYDWAVHDHPSKPIMVAEWGAYHRTDSTSSKAAAFDTVLPQLTAHSAIKAVVYFDAPRDKDGDRNISVDTDATGLAAFRKLAAAPLFKVALH